MARGRGWARNGAVAFALTTLLGGLTVVLGEGPASAATINVNCPADDLQAAIDNAPSGSTINVRGTCVATRGGGVFTGPAWEVRAPKTLTIKGPAVLDGNGSDVYCQI